LALVVCGVLVGSAIISSYLAFEDSAEDLAVQSLYANLSGIDKVFQSYKSLNDSLFVAVKSSPILRDRTDATEPLIILQTSVYNNPSKVRESKSAVIGLDKVLLQFGIFPVSIARFIFLC